MKLPVHDRRARCKPYPELAEARTGAKPFRIHDSREIEGPAPEGMVDLVERRLVVPLVPRGRATSRHELGHVRWSPTKPPDTGVHAQIMAATEDARVNLALARSGIPVELDVKGRTHVLALAASDVEERRHAAVVLRAVASIGTDVERSLRDVARGAPEVIAELTRRICLKVRRRLSDAARRAGAECAPFATVEALAREIERELTVLGLELPPQAGACCLGHVDFSGDADSESDRAGRRRRRRAGRDVEPGSMSLVVAPLEVRVGDCRAVSGALRPAAEGSVVRFVHRYPIDGRIFRRRACDRAGTVLVDTSGSMSLGADDLDQILRATRGAAQVAIYSGSGEHGELRIVARDGRRAAARHLDPYGRGNIVDVPALEWLAGQRGPRVWITDGGVTGVGDTFCAEIQRRCELLVARARVAQVEDVDEAVRALRSRAGR